MKTKDNSRRLPRRDRRSVPATGRQENELGLAPERESSSPRIPHYGELDSSEETLALTTRNRSITGLSGSAHPVLVDPFCDCIKIKGRDYTCYCGEDDTEFEWTWDEESKSAATQLSCDGREVRFHQEYSCGTAAVRGNTPMRSRQYYWEVKMTTPVYGTDMMIGVGTSSMNLNKYRYTFCSLLGSDAESWGLSYTGNTHHLGAADRFAPKFGQGSIIGVHLDTWNGTLAFFKNRQFLGIAFHGLQGKTLYPMVSSTAARSGMKVIKCRSFESSLQYLCILALRKLVPSDVALLEALSFPPGLRTFLQNNLDWLVCSTVPKTETTRTYRQGRKRCHQEIDSDSEENVIPCKQRCRMQ